MPSIQNSYTDADVQAATAALVEAPLGWSEEQDVHLILDAVAPAIAARAKAEALRDFAEVLLGPSHPFAADAATCRWFALKAEKRADEIESGAS